MKILSALIPSLLLFGCRSPSSEKPPIPDMVAVDENSENGPSAGENIEPSKTDGQEQARVKPDVKTQAAADSKVDGIDGEEKVASSSSYGTGVGNGVGLYENVICGLIRSKDGNFFLHDWSDKIVAHLNVPQTFRGKINSDPMRACVSNERLPIDEGDLLEVDVNGLRPTVEGQSYEFFVHSLFSDLKACVEEAKKLEIKVLAVSDSPFDESFRVAMPDTKLELLAKQNCVLMISFADK